MNRHCLLFVVLGGFAAAVLAPVTQAAEPAQADAAMPAGKPDMVEKRIREKEPMSGGMKREGMMKEDVRMHAEKKEKMMEEAMKREQSEKGQRKK
ncbi:MAG: hypothetical protein HY527_06400 [Betaproteobacteria bacterium]|nr:hypothetical protein [Betaproteobacteria bacterium]